MQTSSITDAISFEDADYRSLLAILQDTFVRAPPAALFTTDATDLFGNFLDQLPVSRRRHYTCKACRRFVEQFGGLVTIDEAGATRSAFWNIGLGASGLFADGIRVMALLVAKARVTGVFLSEEKVWGLPSNRSAKALAQGGAWHHMHAVPAPSMIYRPSAVKSTAMAVAEKHEEYGMLCRGLADFPIDVVRQAHTALTTGALYRSEKCIGIAAWLLDLHEHREATKNKVARENLVWRAVATAPAGYAHVRTTMIATLLEDIAAGKPFDAIKRSFDTKMSPLQYQRPQAAPTDGQLAAAEAVVAKLASAGSLERRFARLDEIRGHAIWLPQRPQAPQSNGSVFGHLKTKEASSGLDIPAQTLTWEKFARTVLPTARVIECLVPMGRAPFFAFVTAVNPEAPPILQWDSEAQRNPVSWYLYHMGSMASDFSLVGGQFCEVAAITLQPSGWTSSLAHHGDGAYLVLRGARDASPHKAGSAIFPETLRSEYHGIRSAIEAYSRSRPLAGEAGEDNACGLAWQESAPSAWNHVLRVTSGETRTQWRIDRWD